MHSTVTLAAAQQCCRSRLLETETAGAACLAAKAYTMLNVERRALYRHSETLMPTVACNSWNPLKMMARESAAFLLSTMPWNADQWRCTQHRLTHALAQKKVTLAWPGTDHNFSGILLYRRAHEGVALAWPGTDHSFIGILLYRKAPALPNDSNSLLCTPKGSLGTMSQCMVRSVPLVPCIRHPLHEPPTHALI